MANRYQQAQFMLSVGNLKQLPPESGLEVAFAGRSNAGKSSAINTLTNNKSLARTSKTPGRTQLLNFFQVNEDCRLVDLPGYGFAKVSQSVKENWHKMLDAYLSSRECLAGIVLVMDIRHPLKEFDLTMLDWCQQMAIPAHILLTKSDKLKKGAAASSLLKVQKTVASEFAQVTVQMFSSHTKTGVNQLVTALDAYLQQEIPQEN